jgi:hypothetical protein
VQHVGSNIDTVVLGDLFVAADGFPHQDGVVHQVPDDANAVGDVEMLRCHRYHKMISRQLKILSHGKPKYPFIKVVPGTVLMA